VLRALRKLRRGYPTDAHVFVSERVRAGVCKPPWGEGARKSKIHPGLDRSSRSWRRFRHQLVVEVAATGIGRDDLHLAPGCVPAVAAELARARARRVVLAEDAQARDAVDERELSNHADRAERPGRRVAEDARRKARLDALADVQRVADRVELHGG